MAPRTTTDQLIDLAEAIVSSGFDAHRRDLADVADTARRRGIRPVLAEVVTDPTAPRPVRERALGRLVVAMSSVADAPPSPVTTGAASAA